MRVVAWRAMHALHDRATLEAFFRRDPGLHLYELGDLDDFYWPRTQWFANERAVALLYCPGDLPVLLALSHDAEALTGLARELLPVLPRAFYAHLSPGLAPAFAEHYDAEFHGDYLKMLMTDRAPVTGAEWEAEPLRSADEPEVTAFYRAAYPGNWFDPVMLSSGQYRGVRREGRLAAVAGVHVYSPAMRVAALGNIATHPAHRGQGLARQVTGRCCAELLRTVDTIGLNVRADNAPARRCYASLGFAPVGDYQEFMFIAK